MSESRVDVTEYTVSVYPDPDSFSAASYDVTVVYRGKGRWAVCRLGRCYDRDGRADWEAQPSSRTHPWLNRFRFEDVNEAIRVAKLIAPKVIVNGKSAEQCWEWEQKQRAARAT